MRKNQKTHMQKLYNQKENDDEKPILSFIVAFNLHEFHSLSSQTVSQKFTFFFGVKFSNIHIYM